MQKIKRVKLPLLPISCAIDFAAILFFSLYFYWMFAVKNLDTNILTAVFVNFNPMTWGTYLAGLALILHIVAFKNIIGRCIMATLYGCMVLVSLIAIIGMTGISDLVIYLPHVVIVTVAIFILIKEHK